MYWILDKWYNTVFHPITQQLPTQPFDTDFVGLSEVALIDKIATNPTGHDASGTVETLGAIVAIKVVIMSQFFMSRYDEHISVPKGGLLCLRVEITGKIT